MNCYRLNNILKERYDLDLIQANHDPDSLVAIYEHYNSQTSYLRRMLGESAVRTSHQYSKAYLVAETAKLLLREIAPKRTKRKPQS